MAGRYEQEDMRATCATYLFCMDKPIVHETVVNASDFSTHVFFEYARVLLRATLP